MIGDEALLTTLAEDLVSNLLEIDEDGEPHRKKVALLLLAL